jgi:hypothetical protein
LLTFESGFSVNHTCTREGGVVTVESAAGSDFVNFMCARRVVVATAAMSAISIARVRWEIMGPPGSCPLSHAIATGAPRRMALKPLSAKSDVGFLARFPASESYVIELIRRWRSTP